MNKLFYSTEVKRGVYSYKRVYLLKSDRLFGAYALGECIGQITWRTEK
jgi:hypothetical protein